MRKIQVMGLSILAIILLSLTPASAFNSQEKTFQDVFRSKILESQQINDLENITDPVVRHFVEKKNNISLIMVYKFMQQISNEQSLLPKNESLYDFYADYLNGSNKTYILCESEFTAREAVKNIPVMKLLIDNMEVYVDNYCHINELEQINYIYNEYPQIESIEKNLKNYGLPKLQYVLNHTRLRTEDYTENVPHSVKTI